MSKDITIEIGTFKSVENLRKALKKSGMQVSVLAGDILNKTKLSESKHILDLVALTVGELGFAKGSSLEYIYKAAKEQGLGLCPAELGPQLRLQYSDQPAGEWLVIATEPIKGSVAGLSLFYLRRNNDGYWLSTCSGNPGDLWTAGYRFVFVRGK